MPAAEKPAKSYFQMLTEAALACGHYRVLCSLYDERFSRPLNEAGNAATSALIALARYCRKHDLDARTSPLYECFGGLADWYVERYEHKRIVICEDLSPQAIYQAINHGNIFHWREWVISTSRKGLMDDDYGLPKWDCVVTATHVSGQSFEDDKDGHCRRARSLYKNITGHDYPGDDGLGRDAPHIFERGYCDDDVDYDDDDYYPED